MSVLSKSDPGSEQDVGKKVDTDVFEGNDATDLVRQYLRPVCPLLTDAFQEAIGYQPVGDQSSVQDM